MVKMFFPIEGKTRDGNKQWLAVIGEEKKITQARNGFLKYKEIACVRACVLFFKEKCK
jgi:hypothetical protein